MIALLALGLVLPAAVTAQERTIVVKGTATQEVPNDTASLRFSVTKERTSRAAALRIVAIRLRDVIATVQSFPGVGPGDVSTGEISIRKIFRGKRPLFRASEGVTVILHQPERAGEMVSAAIASGATGTRGPDFFPGNPDVAYNNTLLAAFDQAKAKAAALAAQAGAVLGPAISIEEGAEVVPVSRPLALPEAEHPSRLRPSSRVAPPSPPRSASSSPSNSEETTSAVCGPTPRAAIRASRPLRARWPAPVRRGPGSRRTRQPRE